VSARLRERGGREGGGEGEKEGGRKEAKKGGRQEREDKS